MAAAEEHQVRAFCDPSGGRGDAFALCIGHYHEDKFIADVVRTVEPPFNPGSVVADFSALLKQYGASTVVGDHYSGEWVTGAFKTAGIKYVPADRPKSALYLETLPLFARGLVALPHHPRLIRELRLLERRTHRSGKDTVDHGRSGHEDAANALAGCMVLGIEAARRAAYTSMAWVG